MAKDFLAELNKKLGKNIVSLGKELENVKFLKTGLISLDVAIGGGLPIGRIVELRGLQSVAKTSLSLAMIGEFQKQGISCAFVDAEFSLNLQHARNLGVDTDKLIIVQPDTGEEAFEIIESLIREKLAKVVVVDSLSALATKAELEADVNKPGMGAQARLISVGLRRIIGPVSKNEAVVIMINQMRANINGGQYNQHTPSGGYALKYYTSVVLELKRDQGIIVAEEIMGYKIKVKVEKNKVGNPKEECILNLRFKTGFSSEGEVITLGVKSGIISIQGNTYFFKNKKLGVGENRTHQFLVDNPDINQEILNAISSPQELKQ